MELEGDVGGVAAGGELTGGLGEACVVLEDVEPAADGGGDVVVERALSRVVLDGGGRDEAAAGEHAVSQVVDPGVDDGGELRASWRGEARGLPDVLAEAVDRGAQTRALQRLLAAEAADESALAHAEVGGESPDGEALEALDGGDVDRCLHGELAAACDIGGGAARHHGQYTERTVVL